MRLLCRPPDVDHDVVGVRGRLESVDDVGGPVKALRGPEHLPTEAVGDHHVVPDGHAEHGTTPRRMIAAERGRLPSARRGMTTGRSSNGDSPVMRASKAGSRRRSSAPGAHGRKACAWSGGRGHLAHLAGADAESSRVERTPRARRTSPSPYQLSSITVPSAASRSKDGWRPAEVALACTTRSQPSMVSDACDASAKSTPSAAATSALEGRHPRE